AAGEAWEEMFPLRGKDGFYRWFLARAVPIRDALGRIERWLGTATDVTAKRFLDEAAAILSSSLDLDTTLDKLARLHVPDLAALCAVDLLEGDQLRHVAIRHADEHKLASIDAIAERYPYDPLHDRGIAMVVKTGEPRLVAEVTDAMLVKSARDAEHADV